MAAGSAGRDAALASGLWPPRRGALSLPGLLWGQGITKPQAEEANQQQVVEQIRASSRKAALAFASVGARPPGGEEPQVSRMAAGDA